MRRVCERDNFKKMDYFDEIFWVDRFRKKRKTRLTSGSDPDDNLDPGCGLIRITGLWCYSAEIIAARSVSFRL